MTPLEAVALCRLAKACCPQQQFDEYTADAWGELLGDLRFEDAKQALINVVRVQPFVAPAEIRAEVKRIRRQRIDDYGPVDLPPGLSDEDYQRAFIETTRAVADGNPPPRPELPPARRMPDFVKVFRSVDEDPAPAEARS